MQVTDTDCVYCIQGNMGSLMAANLAVWLHQHSCPPLIVWNRTAAKMPAESDEIKHGKSAQDVAARCDIVFTSMANDEAAKAVYAELFEGVRSKSQGKKTYFVETSTLYPTVAGERRTRVWKKGVNSRSPQPVSARQATLSDRHRTWTACTTSRRPSLALRRW